MDIDRELPNRRLPLVGSFTGVSRESITATGELYGHMNNCQSTMLAGYVSDEMYESLSDVRVGFYWDGERQTVVSSGPKGDIYADISPGEYTVVLAKDGYGSKKTDVTIDADSVHDFRLLSDRLLGYVWPKWTTSGQTAEYVLHTPEDTRLSLWRYGAEKEFIKNITWHDEHGSRTCLQRTPDGDYTQIGVQWNEVGYDVNDPSSQVVTAPSESGLYYFHMESKSGDFFSFPWIVAPKTPQSSLAVISATNTWNAYNSFGGRSNYVNATGLPESPIVEPRSELDRFSLEDTWSREDHEYRPLSFQRPCIFNSIPKNRTSTDPIMGKEESHAAPAEWRMLSWLERNGFKYDLYSDQQLHDGSLDLNEYKALLIHTHPEYWSQRMYERVCSWVFERGGNLVYLAGNGINCAVKFIDDERLVIYNNTENVSDVDHPRDVPEDAYESRFHRRVESEGNLLGVVFTPSGIKTAAPYKVCDPTHWVFEGTDLEEGDRFGANTLQERCAGGASGHETDKLSNYAPDGTRVLAKGLNSANGGAEMVYYESSGGATFSVGSITFPASLFVDEVTATITQNVLNRFLTD